MIGRVAAFTVIRVRAVNTLFAVGKRIEIEIFFLNKQKKAPLTQWKPTSERIVQSDHWTVPQCHAKRFNFVCHFTRIDNYLQVAVNVKLSLDMTHG